MKLLDGYRPLPLELERLPDEVALERSRAFLALMGTRPDLTKKTLEEIAVFD